MRTTALHVEKRDRPLPVSKSQEGFMEEEVGLRWDRIYPGGVGLESHTAILLPPNAD